MATKRRVVVTAEGFRPRNIKVARVRYVGTEPGNPATGSEQWIRILYRHRTGVEIVVREDDLNRANRDHAERRLTEEEAIRIGMRRRENED